MSLPIERCTPVGYDIFAKKPISDACENGIVEYFYPKNDLKTGVFEFVVEGNREQLILPSKIYLKLSMELTGSAKKAASTDPDKSVKNGKATISVVNNIMHSVFESVEVLLSDESITKTDRHYPYHALLQSMCNYGHEPLDTYFELTGWGKDTAGKMEAMDGGNEGFTLRRSFFKGPSAKAEFIGKICSPIFFQEKFLPPQITLKVLLNKAPKHFFLKHEEGDFELNITEAVLMVQKVKPVARVHQDFLQFSEEGGYAAPYFLRRPEIKPISIEASTSHFMRDNLFLGKVPRRIVIGMVDTMAYHGQRDKNPFNFQHFGLREICLYKDGAPYPRQAIKMDFKNKLYADAYHNFMSSLNASYTRNVPNITLDDFANGYTLFSYDMSPDQLGSVHPGSMVNMNSNIRLEMWFTEPVKTNIMLLIYSEFDQLIEIHRDRRVSVVF